MRGGDSLVMKITDPDPAEKSLKEEGQLKSESDSSAADNADATKEEIELLREKTVEPDSQTEAAPLKEQR